MHEDTRRIQLSIFFFGNVAFVYQVTLTYYQEKRVFLNSITFSIIFPCAQDDLPDYLITWSDFSTFPLTADVEKQDLKSEPALESTATAVSALPQITPKIEQNHEESQGMQSASATNLLQGSKLFCLCRV